MQTLDQIADLLDSAPRHEIWPDRREGQPEPRRDPPQRYIKLTDAVARDIAAAVRRHALGEHPRAVSLERR